MAVSVEQLQPYKQNGQLSICSKEIIQIPVIKPDVFTPFPAGISMFIFTQCNK